MPNTHFSRKYRCTQRLKPDGYNLNNKLTRNPAVYPKPDGFNLEMKIERRSYYVNDVFVLSIRRHGFSLWVSDVVITGVLGLSTGVIAGDPRCLVLTRWLKPPI